MVASAEFARFLHDELAPLGYITTRRTFGKSGVLGEGVMFGMVTGGSTPGRREATMTSRSCRGGRLLRDLDRLAEHEGAWELLLRRRLRPEGDR
jgi:DNA transformation protein